VSRTRRDRWSDVFVRAEDENLIQGYYEFLEAAAINSQCSFDEE